ncbi:hypothetical protein EDC65_0220 [Stella humosa]|uniref:Alginate lyase domain-containing protein n=1 Tax=Stella humosa TaxID=94 RepID=A0A3N1MBQ3_9PROT|nr:alginate lyase family protein [Stella humosa]ROQ01048.1 hypothetical protein EDC65_0220 [Stella humosa]BBK31418.1 hypothetical protein STHU_20520 [Stella humosa]
MTARPTFIVYRVLGNDLPPRHRVGQTIDCLRFILRHEPPLADCEKRWVLNRIVDPQAEAEAQALIAAAGQRAIRIPFSLDEYAAQPYAYRGVPDTHRFHSPAFLAMDERNRAPAIDRYLGWRNRYAMHVNGARNQALEDGLADARWVLPLDGQSFIRADAWAAIRAAADSAGEARYLVMPTARLTDAATLLDGSTPPVVGQEPSIGFRSDARERFDAALHYGYADKAALLARLGVSGIWSPSERARTIGGRAGPSPDAGLYRWAGWIARLPSGNADADRDDGERARDRSTAIVQFLRGLDERALGRAWRPGTPLILHSRAMDMGDDQVPVAVGAGQDWRHHAPGILAAAVGDGPSVEDCARRLHAAGIGAATNWRCPPLADAPPFAEALPLVFLLDAILIAARCGALSGHELGGLRTLARGMLAGLLSGPHARTLRTATGSDGTGYEMLVLALAAFVDDRRTMVEALERLPQRIVQQFGDDGAQGAEDDDAERMLANLERWACLARMAGSLGHDLWRVRVGYGHSLHGGILCLLKRIDRADAEDRARLRRRVASIIEISPGRQAPRTAAERRLALAEIDPATALPAFVLLLLGEATA